jgi:sulfur-oxidizing protein SoxA
MGRGAARGAILLAFALAASGLAAGGIPPGERKSGFETMSQELQTLQRDDLANPAMLTAADGERLWRLAPGAAPSGSPSCQSCHGEASVSMRGVSARYPAFDAARGGPLRLSARIAQCRTQRQGAPAVSADLIALEAHVALQSRGMSLSSVDDPRLAPALAEGRVQFFRRRGQLDLSCAQCHDDNHGRRLGGSVIPQGHPTGYPLHRLEWQATDTLSRRIRNCLTGVRAEPLPPDGPEATALELYLRHRAAGMASDAPGVRP